MVNSFNRGYALLIGVSAYQHLRKLEKSTADAQDLFDVLVNHCGCPQAQIALLLDGEATRGSINDKLDWLARRTVSDDTVIIFFSGHGAQRIGGFEPGEYLCPIETDWYNLRGTAISSKEFTIALRAIHARKVVVFLDACHAGGVGEPKDAELQVKAGLSEKAYDLLSAGEGRVVIASCKTNEVSWEVKGMRNGLFTHYLLTGLRGEGTVMKAGYVHIFDLFEYLSHAVPAHAQTLGVVQTPLFKAYSVTQNFAVALATGESLPCPETQSPAVTSSSRTPDTSAVQEEQPNHLLREEFSETVVGLALNWLFVEYQIDETLFEEVVHWVMTRSVSSNVEGKIKTLLDLIEIQQDHRDRARRQIALMGGEMYATPPQMAALKLAEEAIRKHGVELVNNLEKALGRKIEIGGES